MPGQIVPYVRSEAVRYAHQWAFSRNPAYYNYDLLGGDCTNFVSQCIYHGAKVMDFTPDFGWFYLDANRKSPSWTGVDFLRNYLLDKRERHGPFAVESSPEQILPGDVIQMSFSGHAFQHTSVVVEAGLISRPENIFIAAHSIDSDFRPINTYQYKYISFLHILGVYTDD